MDLYYYSELAENIAKPAAYRGKADRLGQPERVHREAQHLHVVEGAAALLESLRAKLHRPRCRRRRRLHIALIVVEGGSSESLVGIEVVKLLARGVRLHHTRGLLGIQATGVGPGAGLPRLAIRRGQEWRERRQRVAGQAPRIAGPERGLWLIADQTRPIAT